MAAAFDHAHLLVIAIRRGTGNLSLYRDIEDLAGLIGLVQMGVLEIHPWGSRIEKLETPDRVTIDLDPDEDLPWERVTEAAIDVREALLGIGLKKLCQDDRRQRGCMWSFR